MKYSFSYCEMYVCAKVRRVRFNWSSYEALPIHLNYVALLFLAIGETTSYFNSRKC